MIIQPFIKTNIKVANIKNHIRTDYDFYIGRPSLLGNPYSDKKESIAKIIVDSRDEAMDMYKEYFYKRIESGDKDFIDELDKMYNFYKEHGKMNICCWCFPKRCHGNIIKEYIVNRLISDIK